MFGELIHQFLDEFYHCSYLYFIRNLNLKYWSPFFYKQIFPTSAQEVEILAYFYYFFFYYLKLSFGS